MPLEQIRPSFQLYQSVRTKDAQSFGHSLPLDYDGDEEVDDADINEPVKRPRPEDMNLLKLGGVGGVTRSGSWGQNLSSRDKSRESFISSLTRSPVEMQDVTFEEDADRRESTDVASNIIRTRSISPDQQRKAALEHVRACSSDMPISSSRASTSSYSAAAFSLRSLSHRNSISSASSSAASLSQSPITTSDSPTAASESGSTGTKTSSRGSQMASTSASTDSSSGTALGDYFQSDAQNAVQTVSPPSSVDTHQIGPGANRVLSIGRGGKSRASEPNAEKRRASEASDPISSVSSRRKGDSLASKWATLPPLSVLDRSTNSSTPLTLSAAAATPDLSTSPTSQSSPFKPAAPRRHTGAFALRSQSALSQSGSALGSFWGGSGGRAAARQTARNPPSYENAPFSQLEARRMNNHSSSGRRASASPSPPVASSGRQTGLPSEAPQQTASSTPRNSNEASKVSNTNALDIGINRSLARPSHVDTVAANASFSTSLSSPRTASLGTDPDSAALVRPPLHHTHTTTNVLRTPTTEEWSRFLAKQGLDPAIVAAGNTNRSGLNSNRNSISHRKMFSDRMSTLNLSSTAVSDFAVAAAVAAQEHHDPTRLTGNAMDTASDPEEDSDTEIQECIRRLGIERTSSGKVNSPLLLPGRYGDEQDSDGEEGSSSDERMQALHEAISRPPSRRGSPRPMLDFESSLDLDTTIVPMQDYQRSKRPNRDLPTAIMGYPLAPPGERRKIDDFVVLSDVGRGAYGLVKRVQLKDEVTGKGVGSEFCIKYIIKSRILADCWRRHKMLGPIPIEIHVLDQLRRLPYKAPLHLPPWSVEELLGINEKLPQFIIDSVGHPSLCKMLDFFEDHEFYYMVMPCFGKGQDLFDYIEAEPQGLSSVQVRCIFGQVADGLRFLHQNNIVHRDIKDENVILDGNGHAQIIDFGSAAHVNKNGRLFDTFSGTLDYAAAEILKGEKYGGKEQDVWALGVVGYVLLCGDCPFWNGEEAIQGLQYKSRAYQVLQERCTPTPSLQSQVDDTLLVELEKRQSDQIGQLDGGGRIQDAADLIQRCLEVEISMRPSMEIVCQHRFLIGPRGWYGPAGWREETYTMQESLVE